MNMNITFTEIVASHDQGCHRCNSTIYTNLVGHLVTVDAYSLVLCSQCVHRLALDLKQQGKW